MKLYTVMVSIGLLAGFAIIATGFGVGVMLGLARTELESHPRPAPIIRFVSSEEAQALRAVGKQVARVGDATPQ